MASTASVMRRTASLPLALFVVIGLAVAALAIYLLTSSTTHSQAPITRAPVTMHAPGSAPAHEDSRPPVLENRPAAHEDSRPPALVKPAPTHDDSRPARLNFAR
jgi:hypothetical protein